MRGTELVEKVRPRPIAPSISNPTAIVGGCLLLLLKRINYLMFQWVH